MSVPYAALPPQTPMSRTAIASFVGAFVAPVAGVVLALVAFSEINKSGFRGRVLAIFALIIGSILTALNLFVLSLIGIVLVEYREAIFYLPDF